MPIGLIAVDAKKKVASLNHVAESVLGLSAGEIGRDAEDVLPEQMWRQMDALRPEGGNIEQEIECSLFDGRAIPLEISASVFHDENNSFLGYVLLFKDLSEVHALRREIARSQRLATVGKLAAGVAHEIRNPLSSIKGFATYFKERYREKSEDRHVADVMIQEVDRLNRVVGQLLEFARPITVSKKLISMQTVVEDSLALIERQTDEKRIQVKTRFQSDIKHVPVDPDRISQVLLNLYLNALESMESDGLLTVCLEEDKEKNRVRIRVSDTGSGIRKEDIPHIFDPYYTTKTSGTGLGLAIVHNILEGHGGDIAVESSVGEGTTFTLFLPYD
jgi:two-component system sensor histidine kinase HydH